MADKTPLYTDVQIAEMVDLAKRNKPTWTLYVPESTVESYVRFSIKYDVNPCLVAFLAGLGKRTLFLLRTLMRTVVTIMQTQTMQYNYIVKGLNLTKQVILSVVSLLESVVNNLKVPILPIDSFLDQARDCFEVRNLYATLQDKLTNPAKKLLNKYTSQLAQMEREIERMFSKIQNLTDLTTYFNLLLQIIDDLANVI